MSKSQSFPSSTTHSVFFVSSSGSPGGAERQLANLLNNLPHFVVNLLILNDNKFLESLIYNSNVTIVYSSPRGILSTFANLFWRLKVDPHSRITLVGWMAKANILVWLVSLFLQPFKSTTLIWNHRSSFFLYQSVHSQLLLFSSLLLSFFSLKKIIHVSNSYSIFSPRLVRFMLSGPKYVICNGYDFPSLLSCAKPRNLFFPTSSGHKLLLICPARFSPEKGHQLLFAALERLTFDFHITLVGTGCNHENPKLMKLISKVFHKVSLIEHSSTIAQLYSSHHYTILFSSSESFPNVIVESMAVSVPCICTDVGESRTIVGPFGFVLKNRTVADACESLSSAYRLYLSGSYTDMCINARTHVINKYSASNMAQSFSSLI